MLCCHVESIAIVSGVYSRFHLVSDMNSFWNTVMSCCFFAHAHFMCLFCSRRGVAVLTVILKL